MAEAGGLQTLFETYQDDGFMVITALNGGTQEDAAAWAAEYGITHPVVADVSNAVYNLAGEGPGYWPYRILIDRGMVIDTADSGMSDSEMEELLAD